MTESSQQDKKSRSQIKREFRELRDLGIRLAGLPEKQLNSIPLSESTRDALLAAKRMRRGALQRQYRHLTSLLANEDVAAVRAALTDQLKPHAEEVAALHEAEHWRDELLSTGEVQLDAFVERYPECDRSHLGQLMRNAQKERDLGKPPKAARLLFRYLRQFVEPRD